MIYCPHAGPLVMSMVPLASVPGVDRSGGAFLLFSKKCHLPRKLQLAAGALFL